MDRANIPQIILIVPVHNEAANLWDEIVHVVENSADYPYSHIMLIENGSTDDSFKISKDLEKKYPQQVFAFKEENKGIGFAYFRGMVEAFKMFKTEDYWLVLSAADMPFKNTDINYFIANNVFTMCDLAIGSKAHRDSVTNYTFKRKMMSTIFYLIRKIILGMKTVDCQGTIFINSKDLDYIIKNIVARNFFFSTELTYLIEKRKQKVIEMPIVLKPEIRPSTVRPLKDGMNMLKQTFNLFLKN